MGCLSKPRSMLRHQFEDEQTQASLKVFFHLRAWEKNSDWAHDKNCSPWKSYPHHKRKEWHRAEGEWQLSTEFLWIPIKSKSCSMCIILTVSHERLTPKRSRKWPAHDRIKGCIIAWAERWIFINHYILWQYGSGFWSCIQCTVIRQNDLPSIFSVFSSKGARIHSWKGKMVVWFRALDEHSDLSPLPGSATALLYDLAQAFLHASVSPKMG